MRPEYMMQKQPNPQDNFEQNLNGQVQNGKKYNSDLMRTFSQTSMFGSTKIYNENSQNPKMLTDGVKGEQEPYLIRGSDKNVQNLNQ